MHLGHALLLLSIVATACAGRTIREPSVVQSAAAKAEPANHAGSRLGPPSPRGLGLRRIDRPPVARAPLALY